MRKVFILFGLLICTVASAQKKIIHEDYSRIRSGTYVPKSLRPEFKVDIEISPQKELTGKISDLEYIDLVGKTISLFKVKNPESLEDVAGILRENSLVEVISRQYQAIYQSSDKKWNVSFEVWNEIVLNGNTYYTDFKLHDFLAFSYHIEPTRQSFLIFAQSEGYD